jgi:hypothetical protein
VNLLSLLLLVQPPPAPADGLAKVLRPIYQKEAEAYSIAVETAPDRPLELKKEPVFEWANPTRNGGQQGAVFLWLRAGRPAALACIFSHPAEEFPGRTVLHELHALDPEKLIVSRDAANKWEPKAGLARAPLPDAGEPAATPAARLVQMRKLAAEFGGYEIDHAKKRWDLRLLPTPLYRYPAATAGVVDGALFALTSDAGTDPEVLLLIEAKVDGGKRRWEFACGRFSDLELRVSRKGAEVYASVPGPDNPFPNDPLHLYRIYPDKVVAADGKPLAVIRQTPGRPFGVTTPVEDK